MTPVESLKATLQNIINTLPDGNGIHEWDKIRNQERFNNYLTSNQPQ